MRIVKVVEICIHMKLIMIIILYGCDYFALFCNDFRTVMQLFQYLITFSLSRNLFALFVSNRNYKNLRYYYIW